MAHLLIVDDEKSICTMLEIAARKEGHRVETVTSVEMARKRLGSCLYDVVISDIRMRDGSGLEVLQQARESDPDCPVILITAYASVDSAVQALNLGAYRYIIKTPTLLDELRLTVQSAVENRALRQENRALKRELRRGLENLRGESAPMKALRELIATIAPATSTVLVTGESGTGKELIARAIHTVSPRADRPFVSINCGAFPETLLESELFGYVKGAFTGAATSRKGLIESADSGTLFLDEIADMSLSMQVKLLRVLQERRVRPVGATEEVSVDVRVIAATNKDLQQLMKDNLFREDLFYRISVIPVHVPPLRERPEDIPELALHFLRRFGREMNKPVHKIDGAAMRALESYSWQGNVRELENAIERAVALEKYDEITLWDLPEQIVQSASPDDRVAARPPDGGASGTAAQPAVATFVFPEGGLDLEQHISQLERRYIEAALQQSGGVGKRAAELLRMSYRSFRHYARKYRLQGN